MLQPYDNRQKTVNEKRIMLRKKQRRQNAFVSKYRFSSYFPHQILKLNAETGQTIDKHNIHTQKEERNDKIIVILRCVHII